MFNQVTLIRAVERFLATLPYEPCLLLVSPEIKTLKATRDFLQERYNWGICSIGRVLTTELMATPPAKRPRRVRSVLKHAILSHETGPVFCTDVDLVFHPGLEQDPLRLFRDASRHAPLIVLWPGTFENDILAYAVEEHGHYRTWSQPDLCN